MRNNANFLQRCHLWQKSIAHLELFHYILCREFDATAWETRHNPPGVCELLLLQKVRRGCKSWEISSSKDHLMEKVGNCKKRQLQLFFNWPCIIGWIIISLHIRKMCFSSAGIKIHNTVATSRHYGEHSSRATSFNPVQFCAAHPWLTVCNGVSKPSI